MITVDLRQFRMLEKYLRITRTKALPFAVQDALNSAAFETQKHWRGEIEKSFTLRNQYTVRSTRVVKARGFDVRRMQSVVGSVAPYMGDQEQGGTVRGRGKHKAIPTAAAAGQSGARTRQVRQRFKLSSINVLDAPRRAYGKRRSNAVALAVAIRKNRNFVLLRRMKGNGRAIFSVRPTKKTVRTKMLWDVSRSSVRVSPEPTLQRTITALRPRYAVIQREALIRQLRRHRVFGFR